MEKIINNEILVNVNYSLELKQHYSQINLLLEWSDKQKFNVIFDSDIDGNGTGELEHKVFNKRNLYFISVDHENNIFGGYVNELISKKRSDITDSNAFVFSLTRNGKVKNKKYNIKKGEEQYAFSLYTNSNFLYSFGKYDGTNAYDIIITKIGYNNIGVCEPVSYECNGEKKPLRDYTVTNLTKRVIVLEMN